MGKMGTVAKTRVGRVAAVKPTERLVPDLLVAGLIDVETTGLDRYRDDIVELSIVLFSFRPDRGEIIEVIDTYVGLQEPSKPISQGAARVHGIAGDQVRGKSLDFDKVSAMLTRAHLLIAHNATFDYAFVTRLFAHAVERPWYCTMNGIDWRKEGYRSKGLQNLLAAHGVEVARAHRALNDVNGVFELLVCRAQSGEPYLCQLVRGAPAIEPAPSAAAPGQRGEG